MSHISRARVQSILKVQNTYYAFCIRFGPLLVKNLIFSLKNILGGGGGGGGGGKRGKNVKIGLKTCFFALRPRNRKTSYSLRRKYGLVFE